jgi:hypothetical protein
MATLNLSPEEFADIALLFLADKAVNPEKVAIGNEHFNTFMEKNAGVIKNKLLKYYLDVDPQRRREYKWIKKVFSNKDKAIQTIRIGPSKAIKSARVDKRKAKELVKRIAKKILKKEEVEKEEIELLLEITERRF